MSPASRRARDAMFAGERINVTEGRPVLHVALRRPGGTVIEVDGEDVVPDVHEVLGQMGDFSDGCATARGSAPPASASAPSSTSASRFRPRPGEMAARALDHYRQPDLHGRFVSNVDGADIAAAIDGIDPAETLFVVSSKTFTTVETLTNAHTARACSSRAREDAVAKHFVAVSTNAAEVRSSASTTPTCSGSGSGSAAATPSTRRSACR
jgi:glucose-6-phosphate isomerase